MPQITGLSIAAFDLRIAGLYKESVAAMLGILAKLDEKPLRDMGDSTLSTDIAAHERETATVTR